VCLGEDELAREQDAARSQSSTASSEPGSSKLSSTRADASKYLNHNETLMPAVRRGLLVNHNENLVVASGLNVDLAVRDCPGAT
jgi:hypothetical protein